MKGTAEQQLPPRGWLHSTAAAPLPQKKTGGGSPRPKGGRAGRCQGVEALPRQNRRTVTESLITQPRAKVSSFKVPGERSCGPVGSLLWLWVSSPQGSNVLAVGPRRATGMGGREGTKSANGGCRARRNGAGERGERFSYFPQVRKHW